MKYATLYNPYADNGNCEQKVKKLVEIFDTDQFVFIDITTIGDYKNFFAKLPLDMNVLLCGGDGTLNRFINNTKAIAIKQKIYLYPCGSGNDFARETAQNQQLVLLDDYIKNLPTVYVNGKEYLFINGVGFGIDGYCCEAGDQLRKNKPNKKINYATIAVKGLLFHYKPTKALVVIDGKKMSFDKVWIAPTMHGKYYGGGMMPTPDQDRNDPSAKNSVMIFHGCGKFKTLCIFPSIFKGKHIKRKKNVTILSGEKITVKFNEPRSLQIDGETITDVIEYTVKSPAIIAKEKKDMLFL